jgi:hypothetical protein
MRRRVLPVRGFSPFERGHDIRGSQKLFLEQLLDAFEFERYALCVESGTAL